MSHTWREVFIGWANPVTIMDTSMPCSSIMDLIRSRICSMYRDLFLLSKNKGRLFALCRGVLTAFRITCGKTLYRLSTLCARHTTTPVLILEEANRAGLQAQNEDQVKQHLIQSLICHANGRELTNYHGVVSRFLRELPLAMVVYMLDYYLPQILPHDKGTADDVGILAAPIRHDPVGMKFHYVRRDEAFCKPRRWVGGWGPRYLASKRERGPARVPGLLGEEFVVLSVDPFDLEPWRNMVTSHSLAGQLVLSLGTWTCLVLMALRHIYFQGYVLCGGKGTAPGCAHMVGGQGYQAYQFVMTRADVPKCTDPMEYVTRHYGKPMDNGRLVAIRFSPTGRPQEQFVVFGLIMDIEFRNKPDWLKASYTGTSVKDKGFGNTLYKRNPKEFELAVLLESLIPVFAPKPLAVLRRQFNELFLWPVSREVLPEDIEVKDVFSLGSTRSARELTAVAYTPASRMVRGLGIQTENPTATVMPPDTKGHLMGLLSVLLRRFLTPWHVPMDIPYDSWFRTVVLPIAAMEDGHFVAAISAVSLAIATGKLDLCIQGMSTHHHIRSFKPWWK